MQETLQELCTEKTDCTCNQVSSSFVQFPPENQTKPRKKELGRDPQKVSLSRGQYRIKIYINQTATAAVRQNLETIVEQEGEYKRVWIYKISSYPVNSQGLHLVTFVFRVIDNPVFLPLLIGALTAAAAGAAAYASLADNTIEVFDEVGDMLRNAGLFLIAAGAVYLVAKR